MLYIDKRIKINKSDSNNIYYYAVENIPKYSIILIERPYKIYKSINNIFQNIKNDLIKYNLCNQFNNLFPRNIGKNKNYYEQKIIKNAFNFDRKNYRNPCILFYGTLFNHSCNPNILFINHNDYMVFYTIYNITKGEQLFIHYIDVNLPLNTRQKLLQQYGFICTCDKCINNDNSKINYNDHHNNIIKKIE